MPYDASMAELDVAPVTVRGPLATTNSNLVTFARMFVHDGRLYVAEGRQRGAIITSVTEYPVPEGEPERDVRHSKAGTWGEWKWKGCGCASSWSRHSVESLVAQAVPLDAPAEPAPLAGVIPDELDVNEAEPDLPTAAEA